MAHVKDTVTVPRAELEQIRDELIELESFFDTIARKRIDWKMLRMRVDALLAQDPDKTPVRAPSGTWIAATEPEKKP